MAIRSHQITHLPPHDVDHQCVKNVNHCVYLKERQWITGCPSCYALNDHPGDLNANQTFSKKVGFALFFDDLSINIDKDSRSRKTNRSVNCEGHFIMWSWRLLTSKIKPPMAT